MILTSKNAMVVITMIMNGRTVDITTKIVTIIMNKSRIMVREIITKKGYHHRDRKGPSDDEDHEDYYYMDYRHGEKDFRDYENSGNIVWNIRFLLFFIIIFHKNRYFISMLL